MIKECEERNMKKKESKLISAFYELRVSQMMDKKVWDLPIINKDVSILTVLSILDGRSHVWVVNESENKDLIGVITRQDVLEILAPPRTSYSMFSVPKYKVRGNKVRAEDVMNRDPVTSSCDEKIVNVLQKMIKHRIRRLPVISKDNKIIGEITLKHLIHKFYLASQYHPIAEDES
jgi:predicted transcriptional regulator